MNLMLVMESWQAGGTEQYVRSLYRALKDRDASWKICVVLLREPAPDTTLPDEKWVDLIYVAGGSRLGAFKRLCKITQKVRPDICHLHLYTSTLAATVAVRSASQCGLLATFHSPLSQWKWRHRLAFRLATSICDTVIGASDLTAKQLRRWRKDTIVSSPAVDVGHENTTNTVVDPHAKFCLVCCGRLSPEKDWITLLDAIASIPRSESIHCQLIGAGPMQAELQSRIEALDCRDRFELVGQLSHSETIRRLALANLSVLPSRFEGFGIAALEAMMLGVPTITADFPASNEYIIPGVTGHQFPIGDSQALSELIIWHLSNRDESSRLGNAGRESIASAYSPARIAHQHEALYRHLCSVNARPST